MPSPTSPAVTAPAAPVTASQPTAAAAATAAPANPAEGQDLVLFLTPLTSSIKAHEHIQLTLMVSGGSGLSNGYVDLMVNPANLKVISATGGDFLFSEGGSLEQMVKKDGTLRLNFHRATFTSDSGTLALVELEALKSGNAPVLIQSGQYIVNKNPIPAKVVNALVTVE